jgi:hypothetical protein
MPDKSFKGFSDGRKERERERERERENTNLENPLVHDNHKNIETPPLQHR